MHHGMEIPFFIGHRHDMLSPIGQLLPIFHKEPSQIEQI